MNSDTAVAKPFALRSLTGDVEIPPLVFRNPLVIDVIEPMLVVHELSNH